MSNIRKAYDVARNDREDLEGKIVDYVFGSGDIRKAIIVGCNRAVGITIVMQNDLKHKLICFKGPVTDTPTIFKGRYICTWDEMFDMIVDMIERDEIKAFILANQMIDCIDGTCNSPCAYSQ